MCVGVCGGEKCVEVCLSVSLSAESSLCVCKHRQNTPRFTCTLYVHTHVQYITQCSPRIL